MHILTLTAPVIRSDGSRIESGEYLVTDLNAFEIAAMAERGTAHLEYHDVLSTADSYGDLDSPERLLIIHPLGYGDALLLTPVLRRFKELHPDCEIYLSCRERSRCIFDHFPYLDGFVDYPLPTSEAEKFSTVVSMENVNEAGEDAMTLHASDAKAKRMGITLADTVAAHAVEYTVTAEELAAAQNRYPHTSKKRIGVQLAASAPNRTVPPGIMGAIMHRLFERGYEVMMLGAPGSVPKGIVPAKYGADIRNLCEDNLSFRESAAVASTCDGIVAPDSVMIHLAGALKIPAVGIFAVIDWELRTKYYPTVRVIQIKTGCDIAPCGFHPRAPIMFPPNGPCAKTGICAPLASVDPDRVVSVLGKQLAEKSHVVVSS